MSRKFTHLTPHSWRDAAGKPLRRPQHALDKCSTGTQIKFSGSMGGKALPTVHDCPSPRLAIWQEAQRRRARRLGHEQRLDE